MPCGCVIFRSTPIPVSLALLAIVRLFSVDSWSRPALYNCKKSLFALNSADSYMLQQVSLVFVTFKECFLDKVINVPNFTLILTKDRKQIFQQLEEAGVQFPFCK